MNGGIQTVDVDPADLDPRLAAALDERLGVGDLADLEAVGRVVDAGDRDLLRRPRHRLELVEVDAGLGARPPAAKPRREPEGLSFGSRRFGRHGAKDICRETWAVRET